MRCPAAYIERLSADVPAKLSARMSELLVGSLPSWTHSRLVAK